ncbi:MAG: nucleotidyl transferase AbiEii/AbiGii toxin family protein [Candidatus Thiodiazotropha sp. (ex Codakia orbicularis)]|nr:nucleotidyl transferase AbiEii/AbiGii toxin family protein [Candidatus Thiodiazotropha sp. (ex Codakia orbicularis)]
MSLWRSTFDPGLLHPGVAQQGPWPDSRQVEQDLIILRALCDLFNSPALEGKIAFRGGTAINKLLFRQSLRYSEDIDLVQMQPEPIRAC